MLKQAYEYFLKYFRRSGHGYGQEFFAGDDDISLHLVAAMPQLYIHIWSLLELYERKYPALSLIQVSSFMEVCYVFGDASVSSFGLSWNIPGSKFLS